MTASQEEQTESPNAANLPGVQSVHPLPSGTEPGSQEAQDERPSASLNLPLSHSRHEPTPPSEYLPLMHEAHVFVAVSANLPGPQ